MGPLRRHPVRNKPLLERKDQELSDTDLQQQNNVVRLAYSGGGSADNWLLNLDIGTVFLSRKKAALGNTQDFTYGVFCLLSKSEKGVRLVVGEGVQQQPVWVDPVRFCNQMDFIEKIGQQQFIEVGDEDNGSDIGPV